MRKFSLKVNDLETLNSIGQTLSVYQPLNDEQCGFLREFLSQITPLNEVYPVPATISSTDDIEVEIMDMKCLLPHLQKWFSLFSSMPGENGPNCITWEELSYQNANKGINAVAAILFSPTLAMDQNEETFMLYLYGDGTAKFHFDVKEGFEVLANFTGTWKEAYLTLAKVMQKGWPQETFPKELEALLTK